MEILESMDNVVTTIIAGSAGAVVGAIVSGFIYWFLDRRREARAVKKYKPARKDLKAFIRRLPEFRRNAGTMESFLENLSPYHRDRISHALGALNILTVQTTIGGKGLITVKPGFHNYTEDSIKELLRDIDHGKYDHLSD